MAPIRTTQADLTARRNSTLHPNGSTLTHTSVPTSTMIGGIPLALPGTGGVRNATVTAPSAAPYSTSPPNDRSPVLSRPRASGSTGTTSSSTGSRTRTRTPRASPTRSSSSYVSGVDSLSSSPTSSSTVATSTFSTSPTVATTTTANVARVPAHTQAEAEAETEPNSDRVRARASIFTPRRSNSITRSPSRMTNGELQQAIKQREQMLTSPNARALPVTCRQQLEQSIESMQQILNDRQVLMELEMQLDHASLNPDVRDEQMLLSHLDEMTLSTPIEPVPTLESPNGRRSLKIQFLSSQEDAAMQRQIRAAEREENEFALTLPTAADDERDLALQQRCLPSYPSYT